MRLLFDAGISGKQAMLRLQAHGRDIKDIDAMFISHDHADHASNAGIYQRKFSVGMYISQKTLEASHRHNLGQLGNIQHFHTGDKVQIGGVTVETIRTPHDGTDPCMFVVEADGRRLGILTDLGHPFDGLGKIIASLDAVFLESNYDPHMLDNGAYPAFLKARIKSNHGHISNHESAALLEKHGRRLQWICLSHLSEQNNTPQLALQTHRNILGPKASITIAPRYAVSDVMQIR